MRAVTRPRGRWIWGASGVITMVALAVPGLRLIGRAGAASDAFAVPQHSVTRSVTVPGRITAVAVDSGGAPVLVRAGRVSRVRVSETLMWNGTCGSAADRPAVTQAVSGGRLALSDPGCSAQMQAGAVPAAVPGTVSGAVSAVVPGKPSGTRSCGVFFDVTTPSGVSADVPSAGGAIVVSGVAGASLDSGGGPVTAAQVTGPLTITSDGGIVQVDGLTGTLNADSGGGPEAVRVPVAATAARSITVSSEGGSLRIVPAADVSVPRPGVKGALSPVPGKPGAPFGRIALAEPAG